MAVPAAANPACGRFCGWFAVASPKMRVDNAQVAKSPPAGAIRCALALSVKSKRMLPTAAISVRDLLHKSAWEWIGLIFAIVVLAWIVVRVRALFHSDDDPAENANQMLSEIREMYDEGKLSEEEFRSIKGRLTNQNDSASAAGGE
jgi:hypothetical protein